MASTVYDLTASGIYTAATAAKGVSLFTQITKAEQVATTITSGTTNKDVRYYPKANLESDARILTYTTTATGQTLYGGFLELYSAPNIVKNTSSLALGPVNVQFGAGDTAGSPVASQKDIEDGLTYFAAGTEDLSNAIIKIDDSVAWAASYGQTAGRPATLPSGMTNDWGDMKNTLSLQAWEKTTLKDNSEHPAVSGSKAVKSVTIDMSKWESSENLKYVIAGNTDNKLYLGAEYTDGAVTVSGTSYILKASTGQLVGFASPITDTTETKNVSTMKIALGDSNTNTVDHTLYLATTSENGITLSVTGNDIVQGTANDDSIKISGANTLVYTGDGKDNVTLAADVTDARIALDGNDTLTLTKRADVAKEIKITSDDSNNVILAQGSTIATLTGDNASKAAIKATDGLFAAATGVTVNGVNLSANEYYIVSTPETGTSVSSLIKAGANTTISVTGQGGTAYVVAGDMAANGRKVIIDGVEYTVTNNAGNISLSTGKTGEETVYTLEGTSIFAAVKGNTTEASDVFLNLSNVSYNGALTVNLADVSTVGSTGTFIQGTVDSTGTSFITTTPDTMTVVAGTVGTGNAYAAAAVSSGQSISAYGTAIAWNITGSTGNDTIAGSTAGGVLDGGLGNDTITVYAGTALGGLGDDSIIVNGSGINVNGGTGNDIIDLTNASSAVVTLAANEGVDKLIIGNGVKAYLDDSDQTGNTYLLKDGTGKLIATLKGDSAAILATTAGASTTTEDTVSKLLASDIEGVVSVNLYDADQDTGIFTVSGNVPSGQTKAASFGAGDAQTPGYVGTVTGGNIYAANDVGSGQDINGSNYAFGWKITGSTGADTIVGGKKNNTIIGGEGNDYITASAGDSITGDGGADTIYAAATVTGISLTVDGKDTIVLGHSGVKAYKDDNTTYRLVNADEETIATLKAAKTDDITGTTVALTASTQTVADLLDYSVAGTVTLQGFDGRTENGIYRVTDNVGNGGGIATFTNATTSSTAQGYVGLVDFANKEYKPKAISEGQVIDASNSSYSWTLNGTTAKDTITGSKIGGIINGDAGDDTITVYAGTAYGDAGNDTITAIGNGIVIDGGSGADQIDLKNATTAAVTVDRSDTLVLSDDAVKAYKLGDTSYTLEKNGAIIATVSGADAATVLATGVSISSVAAKKHVSDLLDCKIEGLVSVDLTTATTKGDFLVDTVEQDKTGTATFKADGSSASVAGNIIGSVTVASGNSYTAATGTGTGQFINASGSTAAWNIIGSTGADTIKGSAEGENTIFGGAGDDSITAYTGDSISGGAGKDTIDLATASATGVTVNLDGSDTLVLSGTDLKVYKSGSNYQIETAEGSTMAVLTGNDSNAILNNAVNGITGATAIRNLLDYKIAGGVDVTLTDRNARAGYIAAVTDDVLAGGKGTATIISGNETTHGYVGSITEETDGNAFAYTAAAVGTGQTITASGSIIWNITGSTGADKITGSAAGGVLKGGDGNDEITITAGTAFGEAGNDKINATGNNVYVDGGAGDDTITISGTTGVTVTGGEGNDKITGSVNAEYIIANGADEINSGGGNDTIDLAKALGAAVNLTDKNATLVLAGINGATALMTDKDINLFDANNNIIAVLKNADTSVILGTTISGVEGATTVSDLFGGTSNIAVDGAAIVDLSKASGKGAFIVPGGVEAGSTGAADFSGNYSANTPGYVGGVGTVASGLSYKGIKGTAQIINASASTNAWEITGTTGNDSITAGVNKNTISGGLGADTINLTAASAAQVTVDASDVLVLDGDVRAFKGTGANEYTLQKDGEIIATLTGENTVDILGMTVSGVNGATVGALLDYNIDGKVSVDLSNIRRSGAFVFKDNIAATATTTGVAEFDKDGTALSKGFVGLVDYSSIAYTAATNKGAGQSIDASKSTAKWTITGSTGADTITGSSQGGVLNGGLGDDSIVVFAGTVNGGSGADTINLTKAVDAAVTVDEHDILVIADVADTKAYKNDDGTYTLALGGTNVATLTAADDDTEIKNVHLTIGTDTSKTVNDFFNFEVAGKVTVDLGSTAVAGKSTGSFIVKDNVLATAVAEAGYTAATTNVKGLVGSIGTSTNTYTAQNIGAGQFITAQTAADAWTITGSSGADTIVGSSKGGVLTGGAGNDTITVYGSGTANGGEGDDTITAIGNAITINGNSGADRIDLTQATTATVTLDGEDTLVLSDGMRLYYESSAYTLRKTDGTIVATLQGEGSSAAYVLGTKVEGVTGTTVGSLIEYSIEGLVNVDLTTATSVGIFASTQTVGAVATQDATFFANETSSYAGFVGAVATDGGNVYTAADVGKGQKIDAGKTTVAWSITGSSGADTIVGSPQGGTIKGGAGNDSITVNGYGLVEGGLGTDIIDLTAVSAAGTTRSTTINISDANDTLVLGTSAVTVAYKDDATESYQLKKDDNVLFTLTGDNDSDIRSTKITMGTTSTTVENLLDFQVNGVVSVDLTGGEGTDLIAYVDKNVLAGSTGTAYVADPKEVPHGHVGAIGSTTGNVYTYQAEKGSAQSIDASQASFAWSITGTTGNDTISGSPVSGGTLEGGLGNDLITVNSDTFVNGGAGIDTINIGANAAAATITGITNGADVLNADVLKFNTTITSLKAATNGDGNVTISNDTVTLTFDDITNVGTIANINVINGNGSTNTLDKFLTQGGGFDYSDNNTVLTFTSDFTETTVKASDYLTDVRTIDARNVTNGLVITDDANALTIYGTSQADTLVGGTGANTLYGGAGNDRINGNAGNDNLSGETGNDIIDGGAGNDILDGGSGADTLNGGAGDDTLTGGAGSDVFQYASNSGKDVITDFATADKVQITSGSISKTAANGNNVVLTVGGGTLTLNDAVGSNITVLNAKNAATTYYVGKAAANTKSFSSLKNALYYVGGSKVDKITGTNYADTIYGGAGDDSLVGGKGNDKLYGDAGKDTLNGGAGADTLTGGAAADLFLFAKGGGKDVITDYVAGTDQIKITSGTISTAAASGKNVVLTVTKNTDTLTVNSAVGKNITVLNSKNAATTYYVGAASATKKSFSSLKNGAFIVGGKGGDKFTGTNYADTIYGGAGADSLVGGKGNDKLFGDAGQDTLNGGAGADTLTGGADADLFVIGSKAGKDVITDYSYKQKDKISISGKITSYKTSGNDVILTLANSSHTLTIKGARNNTVTINNKNYKINGSGQWSKLKASSTAASLMESDNVLTAANAASEKLANASAALAAPVNSLGAITASDASSLLMETDLTKQQNLLVSSSANR